MNNILSAFLELPGKISAYQSPEQFKKDWETILGSEEARKHKGIIYLWRSEKSIPRLKGESDIIYIGKTKNSIATRHLTYGGIEANGKRNRPRYEYILENYGAISFHVALYNKFGEDPKTAEQNLLSKYFDNHLEYPPLNRMGK